MLSLFVTLLILLLLTTFGLLSIGVEDSFWPVAMDAEDYRDEFEKVR